MAYVLWTWPDPGVQTHQKSLRLPSRTLKKSMRRRILLLTIHASPDVATLPIFFRYAPKEPCPVMACDRKWFGVNHILSNHVHRSGMKQLIHPEYPLHVTPHSVLIERLSSFLNSILNLTQFVNVNQSKIFYFPSFNFDI